MPIIPGWTKARIDGLVDARSPEGRRLEYKLELPGPTDADKREFLKDVTSFSNTSGGTLLYGIEGERDGNGRTTGAPSRAVGLRSFNRDQVLQRLENLLLTSVAPRLFGASFSDISGFLEGPVLVAEIRRSWTGPHRVTLGGSAHFYARNDGGAYPMDVNELREAFLGAARQSERLRGFRRERALVVESDEPVVSMAPGPKVLLHLIPLNTHEAEVVDLTALNQPPPPFGTTGFNQWRYNLDGILSLARAAEGSAEGYALVFRNGAIEAVGPLTTFEGPLGNNWFALGNLETELTESYERYARTLRGLGVIGPLAVMVSIIGARGMRAAVGGFERQSLSIDRQSLFLPEIVVEDLNLLAPEALLPVFESLWNACGALRPRPASG